jgi:micrococcal nuclease
MLKPIIAALFLFALFACNGADETPKLDGKVVSIADGDTFTLLTPENKQVKIRLHGIDCPERSQDYGTVARQKLSDLIFGQPVRIEEKDTDRYGRTIAIVYNVKGVNINEQLLKEGLAWHYTAYDKNPAWTALEQQARRQKAGLWAQPAPIAPWEFRKIKRAPAKAA